MYRRHNVLSIILFVVAFSCGIIWNLDYSRIAESAITVISIALAIYVSTCTALLGSAFSKSLKIVPDKEDNTQSMLGRLSAYLRIAGTSSIMTIAISSIYILKPDSILAHRMLGKHFFIIARIASATSCALFALDFFLMYTIINYLITALLNAAITRE